MLSEQTRNAIVTGSRKGIGRAIVERLASDGINIWACARSQNDGFEEDMRRLSEKYGVWIKPVYFDLADDASLKTSVMALRKAPETIDILVNNAGTTGGSLLQMTSMDSMKEVFQINYFAPMRMIQLVSPKMIKQKKGSIINISSVEGMPDYPGNVSYGASKAAIAFATKRLSDELGGSGIRVNAVAPGLIDTDMGMQMDAASQAEMVGRTAVKRLGTPAEIADAVAYLASDRASFITGQVIRVDGGL